MDQTDWALALLILVALAAAVALGADRVGMERANRTVELIVDADDVHQLAVASGESFPKTLAALKAAGATALAVKEATLQELVASGRLIALSTPEGTVLGTPDADAASVVALASAIQQELPKASVGLSQYTPAVVLAGVGFEQIAEVPVMFRPEEAAEAKAHRLRLVARPLNFPAVSAEAVRASLERAAEAGARLVIFRNEEVLGFPALVPTTAKTVRDLDLLYGYIEIAAQKGDHGLASKIPERTVRVHSITDADLLNLSPETAVARYLRAVRERGVRACYVRLMPRFRPDPLAANTQYVESLARRLKHAGFITGPPAPLRAPEGWPPWHLRALVLLALPAAAVLLLRRLMPLRRGWSLLLFLAITGIGLAVARWHTSFVVPLSGLAAACIFPALGVVVSLQWARRKGAGDPASANPVAASLMVLAGACAVSLAGGLIIAGLYSRTSYLVGAAQFVGVKLSYLSPLPIVLLAVIADLPGRMEPLSLWWTRLRVRLTEFFARPVLVIEAAAILLAVGAIGFALMRSGNQSAVAPAAVELKLRTALESLLVVRPRLKEFLIGHPMLMLAAVLAMRGRRTWLPLVALLAAVGQVSLVNTFCHFHMPLLVSLLRTLHGLWIGALLGLILVLAWMRFFGRASLHRQT